MNALSMDITYDRTRLPPVMLFGDDSGRRGQLERTIAMSGGRVVTSEPVDAAFDQIGTGSTMGVVVDLQKDGGAKLDGLLIRLNALAATAGRLSVLVLAPADMIDVVTARIDDPGTAILVDADADELDAALAALVAPLPRSVADSGGEGGDRRLAKLSEEVGRIARTLAELSADEDILTVETIRGPAAADGPLVRAMLRLRRLRGQFFTPALFADPAWDILLDLTAARIERRSVAASSLCIAAGVPATTALRWISQMTEQQLLVRCPDPRDGRRVFIGLSDMATAAMDAYLAGARRLVAPVG